MSESILRVRLSRPGGPEVLELVGAAMPQPARGEVRVRAEAIGVGKPDAMIRRGIYPWMPPLPATPGNELAGVIDAVGQDANDMLLGLRVLVSARELPQRGGCYAEAICVPATSIYVLPDAVAAVDAVTLPNYQMAGALLFDSGVLQPQSILVLGAAGGVATALIQLGAAEGIVAIGVASNAAKCAFAHAAGAFAVIDRSREDVRERVLALTDGRGVDLVLDHVGGPAFGSHLDLLAARGTLLSYNILAGLPEQNIVAELRRLLGRSLGVRCYSIHALDHEPVARRALMQRAIALMAEGRLRPPPAEVMPLSQVRRAHERLDAGDVLGKLVLIPDRAQTEAR